MAEFRLNFTGIGAAKGGTTWIAHCLGEHPSVCMSLPKETNFFLRKHISSCLPVPRYRDGMPHYDEGLEWYKRKFSHHKPGQIYGEFSNAYLADPESAGLLHAHNPEMKLLCCFRNPVDAAYAGYFQFSRVQPLPEVFEDFLASYPQLLEYGRYHHNLQPFLKLFPREQICLMLYDDIRTDPAAFYRGICEFLEIESYAPRTLRRRVNPRTVVRSRMLHELKCAIASFMARSAATRKFRKFLMGVGVDRIALKVFRRLNETPGTVPLLAPETRRRLVEFYRKDNEALAELMGRDLSRWNDCASDRLAISASGPAAVAERSLS